MGYIKLIIDLRGTLFKVYIRSLHKKDNSVLNNIAKLVRTPENDSLEDSRLNNTSLKIAIRKVSCKIENIILDIDSQTITIELDHTPVLFHYILDYYTSGSLHLPSSVCSKLLKKELEFWGLTDSALGTCCWGRYKEDQERQNTLQIVQNEWGISASVVPPAINSEEQKEPKTFKARVTKFLEQPRSSRAAQVCKQLVIQIVFTCTIQNKLRCQPSDVSVSTDNAE